MEPLKTNSKIERLCFSKHNALLELPNLIEVQVRSYNEFLQYNTLPSERKSVGFCGCLKKFSDKIFRRKYFIRVCFLQSWSPQIHT